MKLLQRSILFSYFTCDDGGDDVHDTSVDDLGDDGGDDVVQNNAHDDVHGSDDDDGGDSQQ